MAGAPVEVERKFLVVSDGWRTGEPGVSIAQGYLAAGGPATVRVRRMGDSAYLTIKGRPVGGARPEFEYPIPVAHAEAMLALCPGQPLAKTRYRVPFGGRTWEVDVFEGRLAGLVLAEVELDRIDAAVDLPPWVGREVTDDPRYLNENLAQAERPP